MPQGSFCVAERPWKRKNQGCEFGDKLPYLRCVMGRGCIYFDLRCHTINIVKTLADGVKLVGEGLTMLFGIITRAILRQLGALKIECS